MSTEEILDTLSNIRQQITTVLKTIKQVDQDSTEKKSPSTMEEKIREPQSTHANEHSQNLSRDDVKAQREAKKAAKLARKNKSLGIAGTEDSDKVNSDASKEKPTVPANNEDKGDNTLSREDVLAQREAKKAAKLARKNKSLESTAQSNKPKPNNESQKTSKDKVKPSNTTPLKKDDTTGENVLFKKAETTSKAQDKSQEIANKSAKQVQKTSSQMPTEIKKKTNRNGATNNFGLSEEDLKLIYPKFKELGMKYANNVIQDSNKRTIALIRALQDYIRNYRTPPGKGFKQDLSSKWEFNVSKLQYFRPFAVGMSSAVEAFNAEIRSLEEELSDEKYIETLGSWCDNFIEDKIDKAKEAIAMKGAGKIKNGDTILAFSITDVVYEVFKFAGRDKKCFNVVLALTNSGDYLTEYSMLKESVGETYFLENIRVSFISVSSIMSLISSVDKVFLGGHALFTTGGVMARAGSSVIAMCANHHNIPVVFFCETYKFCDKSPTDPFYHDVFPENKLNISNKESTGVSTDDELSSSRNARIVYDVTPSNLVTCVITDIDMLPSSSVPVVLRVQETRPMCLK